MIVYDPCSFQQYLSSSKKGLKKSGLKRDLNPDLNAMPMYVALHAVELSLANWELAVVGR